MMGLNFVSERFLMKNRTLALFSALVLIFNIVGLSFAAPDTKRAPKRKAKANVLVSMLPASDAVVTVNGKRFFSDALPKVLSGHQKLLVEVLGKLDKMQTKTGIDLRKFENIAAGITINKKGEKDFDFEPVIVARGSIDSSTVVAAAKKAADGKFKEELVGRKTMYVFSAIELAELAKQKAADPEKAGMIDNVTKKLSSDMALAAIDNNTVAFGYVSRVRQTLERKTSVSADLAELLVRKEAAVVNLAAKVPQGMSALLPLDNDELGANIDSIRYLYGSLDVAAGQAIVSLTARTLQAQQAIDLKETLEGLRELGKMFLAGSKKPDQQLYARLIANVKLTRTANELSMDLTIPQSDLDALVAVLKK